MLNAFGATIDIGSDTIIVARLGTVRSTTMGTKEHCLLTASLAFVASHAIPWATGDNLLLPCMEVCVGVCVLVCVCAALKRKPDNLLSERWR